MDGAAILSDEVRSGIVRARAPSELARYLHVAAIDYGDDYSAFRRVVEAWAHARVGDRHAEEDVGIQKTPMVVDFVSAAGKGRG